MFILTSTNTIANHFIAELRDVTVQQDAMRFRRNMERLGEVLAYEISKTLGYEKAFIQSPLAIAKTELLSQQPVLVAILRASLPFHQGFINVFDKAQNAFIGAYRGKHRADETFDIQMDYLASPDLTGKTIILIDPMLATGKSLLKSYEALLAYGKPAKVIIAAAITAPEGLAYLQRNMPEAEFFVGTVDDHLNEKYYIVPGLGDAGDLAFGLKL
ncbi:MULTISPECIES: uracil phosphoribosyltransferase [unclassified Arcicella]|uniref:uracil phosphoribosyltransferase n=1 Tax=unclassified Arcicella TaxID=2644986 RepID=UPI002867AB14|nr:MULTISPECIES: uracil phosphoribosyltransferase [unclassified Arcicella]MDR6561044.1 uracil phosphoribosyltransferase [Arcicella sp. BE51]MDR6810928.1 uracil phosphoribosyltransferase [Arcicella sp. BE140]MDR6822278.1 uracil phosphoribosyltransferase [Arcicella sp. BE139]